MQKYFNNVIDTTGAPIVGASVNVTIGSSPATVYSDNGITVQPQPFFTDAFGYFSFYAADGVYSITISGVGITTQTFTNVTLFDPYDGIVITAPISASALVVSGTSQGFSVKEGANAKQGVQALTAGSAVVANTSVTATSRIFLTSNADGGTPGFLRVSARSAGVSFTITSSSGTDTSTVAYQIFEPA